MTTLRVPIRYGPIGNAIKVYALTPKKEVFKAFFEVPSEDSINIYGTLAMGDMKTVEYLPSSATEFEPIYDALLARHILQQPIDKNELMRESLSALKPEIMGLSLGSILSFGVGIFALVTNNPGLATVMAGPFLASILGFSLLWIGFRRNRR